MASPSNLFITSPLRLSRALAAVLVAASAACTVDKNLATAGDDSLTTDPSTTDVVTEDTTLAPGSTTDEATTDEPTTDEPTTDGSTTDQSTTAELTTAELTTDESTTDAIEPDNTDYNEMAVCGTPHVCGQFDHSFAEGDPYHPEMVPLLPGEECIWTGLRDGAPGRYTYSTDHEFSNGNEDVTYIIHVHADRKVTFASSFKLNLDGDEEDESGFRPAKTCTLAEPAFFDDCLQSDDPNGYHPDCAWTQKWWVDCVEDGPKYE